MARYLLVAREANVTAQEILDMIPEDQRPAAAEKLARLFNYGFRCNPRAAMATVRLNAVQAAMRGLPVKVSMVKKPGLRKPYNALTTQAIYTGRTSDEPTVEGDDGGDE